MVTTNIKKKILNYVLATFGSAGFVANLSLLSPCSSYNKTTRSYVQTAILLLFGDHAKQQIFAAPSCQQQFSLHNVVIFKHTEISGHLNDIDL